jgi:predicted ATP-dependent serine protease
VPKTIEPPDYCPRCGAERLWLFSDKSGITAAEMLKKQDSSTIVFRQSALFERVFPRGVPSGPQLWFGGPGSGKSRLSMRFGCELGHCAYISLEMGHPVWLEMVQQSCPTERELNNIRFFSNVDEFFASNPTPECVVVDSVQYLGRRYKSIARRLHSWAASHLSTIVWISQINAKGQRRGGPSLAHAVDIELEITPGNIPGTSFINTRKNRLSLYSPRVLLPLSPAVSVSE